MSMEAVATFSDPQNHFETIPHNLNMLRPEAFVLLPPSFLWFGLMFCAAFSPGGSACSLIGLACPPAASSGSALQSQRGT